MNINLPFLTLRKHIELDVYTDHAAVHEAKPIRVRSKSAYMQKDADGGRVNMSSCYGFIELLKRSAVMHSWMDWEMLLLEDKRVMLNFSGPESLGVEDHTDNAPNFASKEGLRIIRISPSIKVQCKEDIPFMLSPPAFLKSNLSMPSGVTDFKHQHAINFFVYLDDTSTGEWTFNQQDQMLAITAMSERPLKINCHYDKAHYLYLHETSVPMTKKNGYIKKKRIMKGLEDD